MAIKKEEIKIRLTKEEKSLIKRVAKMEGKTMSEFILLHMVQLAENKEKNYENKDKIERRIDNMEGKLQDLKGKMESKKGNKKWFSRTFDK